MSPVTGSKVIGYVRVSTEEQASSGLSLQAQEEKIRAYAELYGVDLVDVIVDAGYSGKDLKRPGIQTALQSLKSGDASGIIVSKLDRLTRSVKDLGALIDGYFGEKAGSHLLVVGEQIDTRTAGGRLVLNVLASVSQWEREVIAERTKTAMAVKRSRGEFTGGMVPYGMRTTHAGKLAPDHVEQATLRKIHDLRQQGLGAHRIIRALEEQGLKARSGKWHVTAIIRILKGDSGILIDQ